MKKVKYQYLLFIQIIRENILINLDATNLISYQYYREKMEDCLDKIFKYKQVLNEYK